MMKKLLALLTALAMILSCASVMAETATATGTATVQGFGGDITVSVTLDGTDIQAVEITGPGETEGIGSKIINEWPLAFVEYNGIVDTYTGATFAGITRAAVIQAMRDALTNAGEGNDEETLPLYFSCIRSAALRLRQQGGRKNVFRVFHPAFPKDRAWLCGKASLRV